MDLLSTPSASATAPAKSDILGSGSLQMHHDNAVGELLQTHENDLKSKIPSTFAPQVSEMPSPSKIFNDYALTGEPMLKEAAGNALKAMQNSELFNTDIKDPKQREKLAMEGENMVGGFLGGGADSPAILNGIKDVSTAALEKILALGKSSLKLGNVTSVLDEVAGKIGMRAPEKAIYANALADSTDAQGMVDVNSFVDKVHDSLLPLNRIGPRLHGGGYEGTTLPTELRGPIANYSEHVYESPIETSASNVHPSLPDSDSYFAHTRVEDLPKQETFVPRKGKFDYNTVTDKLGNKSYDLLQDGKVVRTTKSLSEAQGHRFGNSQVDPAQTQNVRRVIELQSDLMQKGGLDKEIENAGLKANRGYDTGGHFRGGSIEAHQAYIDDVAHAKSIEIAPLRPYENTWHERIIREEVKQAAIDGKTKLQFPVGETAGKIEGFMGETKDPFQVHIPIEGGRGTGMPVRNMRDAGPEDIKVGNIVHRNMQDWVITDDSMAATGQFRAMPKEQCEKLSEKGGLIELTPDEITNHRTNETFDLNNSTKYKDLSDEHKTVYDFYEKTVGKFLKNKYGATRITDPQGVEWWQMDVPKDAATKPVQAFGKASVGAIFSGAVVGIGALGAAKATELFSKDIKAENPKPKDQPKLPTDKWIQPADSLESIYTIPKGLLKTQMKRENDIADAKAVHFNHDGTQDLGLMQINSRNIPFIKNEFAKQGRKFDWKNPENSLEAAAILHKQNKSLLAAAGIAVTEKNMFDAYNVGVAGLKKALLGDTAYAAMIKSYEKGSMFQ